MIDNNTEFHGNIVAISVSKKRGIPKSNIQTVNLIKKFGLEGDIHGGDWHRQISLLAMESIEKMRQKGLKIFVPARSRKI